jgi:putative flippase GtrA
MTILIPAYEPDHRLVDLVADLRRRAPGQDIVVVDDGSGPRYAPVFGAALRPGVELVTVATNRGKGYALKTGFAHIAGHGHGDAVVCADSDGQHRPEDIVRVAAAIQPRTVVLGARQFAGAVPLRSRFGNEATRWLVALATGLRVRDTQTGLRGYPPDLLEWLGTVPGERFEYEMDALLAAQREGLTVTEVPISTVYLDGNSSSHFRPLVDSLRVCLPLARFAVSSLFAFVLDAVMLLGAMALTGHLLASVVGARLVSGAANFAVNRRIVFARSDGPVQVRPAARRYATLATVLLAANYSMLRGLTTGLGLSLLTAKVLTEAGLFLASFLIQRHHVFRARPTTIDSPDLQALVEV